MIREKVPSDSACGSRTDETKSYSKIKAYLKSNRNVRDQASWYSMIKLLSAKTMDETEGKRQSTCVCCFPCLIHCFCAKKFDHGIGSQQTIENPLSTAHYCCLAVILNVKHFFGVVIPWITKWDTWLKCLITASFSALAAIFQYPCCSNLNITMAIFRRTEGSAITFSSNTVAVNVGTANGQWQVGGALS